MGRSVFGENIRNRWAVQDALVLFAMAILLCLRRPDMLIHPQLWGEDGKVFLTEQREVGIASLFVPYAGYLHLVPRLVALLVGTAPLTWVPALYTGAAFILTLLAALWVLHCRVPLPYRVACALAIVLVPHRDEVLLVLVNVQWVLGAVLALLLLQEPPENRRQFALDLTLAVLLGLTGPFVLLFSPLTIYLLVRDWRDHKSRVFCGVVMGLALIQALVLITHPEPIYPLNSSPMGWVLAILCIFPGSCLLGPTIMGYLPAEVVALGSLILIGAMGVAIKYLPSGTRLRVVMLFLASAIVYLAALRKWSTIPWTLDPFSSGQRYFYLAYLLGVWGLLIMAQTTPRDGRWLSRICLGMMLVVSLFNFTYRPLVNYRWRESARRVEQGEVVEIPINPEGWSVILGPKQKE